MSKKFDPERDIKVRWVRGESDIVCWAPRRCDSALVIQSLCFSTYGPGSFEEYPSLREELEKRGYDITTMRFSISKLEGDS